MLYYILIFELYNLDIRMRRATISCAMLLAAAPARLSPIQDMRFFSIRCTPSIVSPDANDPAAENKKI